MMKAIQAALDPSDSQDHVRIVCFMTDGYVGNDMEIISEVQKHPNARVFAFGIGGAVNRFLLDKMAEHGRGEVEYVASHDDGSAAARRFHERSSQSVVDRHLRRLERPPVSDVYPQRIPDLFSAKPVILTGRYTAGARGVIRLRGRISGRDLCAISPVIFPIANSRTVRWQRYGPGPRVDDLMGAGLQRRSATARSETELKETIIQLGLDFRLMTQFTSFVAVEEMIVTDGGAAATASKCRWKCRKV